jgi:hypothetical protein
MIELKYQKRKNSELFKSLESSNILFLSKIQNYIPIYNRFFSLNKTNFNNINLNHNWYISDINIEELKDKSIRNTQIYSCIIKNINTQKIKYKNIFFKLAPLIDPFKLLVGKYCFDEKLFNLPNIDSNETNTLKKYMDTNNSAYVDGFFLYLNSILIYTYKFYHGVDYYGSFLAVKNNFTINVVDELDYLNNSEYFNKNKNVLFTIDDYEHLLDNEEIKLTPLKIDYNSSIKSNVSVKSINNDIFENVFSENEPQGHLKLTQELIEVINDNSQSDFKDTNNVTLKSSSTCSSRTSYTEEGDACENCDNLSVNGDENENEGNKEHDENEGTGEDDETEVWEEETEESEHEEVINVTMPAFPVQAICMECCENTFDNLILTSDLTPEEWLSAFMQIIMILITYQKAFAFTHNDLHTNNVMYNSTEKKYIYYCYKKKYYKVPTFGRIFKIIDFGRSIYKFNGNLFCSDSFQHGEDASSQYNTEPYFNEKKPRLEPNFSFDICRLACSIFDYLVEDMDEIKDLNKCDPIKKLVVEWCLDDKGINMLYKNNGVDRYPEFKLYKMIARCVHNHTPQLQLNRPEFKQYLTIFKEKVPEDIINIDKIPSFV